MWSISIFSATVKRNGTKKKVYYGATDCPLTSKGEAEAAALRRVFLEKAVDCCFVSPLKRTVDTARLVFPEQEADFFRHDQDLKELNFGDWEGKHHQELAADPHWQRWAADYENVAPPGGESFRDLSCRVGAFRTRLLGQKERRIAIVAHHGVLTLLLAQLLSLPDSGCWHFTFRPGRYSHLRFADGFPILEAHNIPPQTLPAEKERAMGGLY